VENAEKTVLIVEDNPDILEILKYNIAKEGFQVLEATDGKIACAIAAEKIPSLVLLDLMLPIVDGLQVCKFLKRNNETKNIPIIMVSAKDEESDIVIGLELGAEDYVTKPFSPKELLARVKAVFRRIDAADEKGTSEVKYKDLVMRFDEHEAFIKNKKLKLTKTEFDILWSFLNDRNQVFTRKQLLQIIHGPGIQTLDRNIDVHIVSLRKKLKEYGDLIQTVRGIGYRSQF
jgi:two-component system alkaline phosphatase synthesis response regulator PhoP